MPAKRRRGRPRKEANPADTARTAGEPGDVAAPAESAGGAAEAGTPKPSPVGRANRRTGHGTKPADTPKGTAAKGRTLAVGNAPRPARGAVWTPADIGRWR